MSWRRFMSWLFPAHGPSQAERRLDGLLSEGAQAGEALSQAASSAVVEADRNAQEADRIAERARNRIRLQEQRRALREKAARERGVILAVDDALTLRSFGGPGDED